MVQNHKCKITENIEASTGLWFSWRFCLCCKPL